MQVTCLPQEHKVWLVLDWHEHDDDSVKELQPLQRRNAHVKEDTEQHRHRNVPQQRRQQNRAADSEEDEDVRDPLLANAQELWFFTWCCTFRFQLQ